MNRGPIGKNYFLIVFEECEDDHIYDPFSEICRKVACKGKECSRIKPNVTCTEMTRLALDEYDIYENSTVIERTSGIHFPPDYYSCKGQESGVLVCVELNKTYTRQMKQSVVPFVEKWLTFSGLLLSIIFLTILILIFSWKSELRNIPGKCLMCLSLSLLVSQITFLTSPRVEKRDFLCKFIAILLHYGWLSSFCWMTAISIDVWRTFAKSGFSSLKQQPNRFTYYCLFCWFIPLIIVAISILIDNLLPERHSEYKPAYGVGKCWISNQTGIKQINTNINNNFFIYSFYY